MFQRLPDEVIAQRMIKCKVLVCRHKRTRRCRICGEKVIVGQLYFSANGYVTHRQCVVTVLQIQDSVNDRSMEKSW